MVFFSIMTAVMSVAILIGLTKKFILFLSSGRCKVKLATLVEGDPKASFSIATTPRCRGGCYSIPWIAPLYP